MKKWPLPTALSHHTSAEASVGACTPRYAPGKKESSSKSANIP